MTTKKKVISIAIIIIIVLCMGAFGVWFGRNNIQTTGTTEDKPSEHVEQEVHNFEIYDESGNKLYEFSSYPYTPENPTAEVELQDDSLIVVVPDIYCDCYYDIIDLEE